MIVECQHWSDYGAPRQRGLPIGGACALGFHDGRPSIGTCLKHCPLTVDGREAIKAPDQDRVDRARKRAETRGWKWLAHGAVGVAKWWLRLGRAERRIATARLIICQHCEFYTEGIRCQKCGCGFTAKVADAREVCPIGKW